MNGARHAYVSIFSMNPLILCGGKSALFKAGQEELARIYRDNLTLLISKGPNTEPCMQHTYT